MHHKTTKRTDYGPRAVWFGRTVIRFLGWSLVGQRPEVPKFVVSCAPHTSNWDLFYTIFAAMGFRVPAVFTLKDFWFFWPLGPFFRWLGGIPINRSVRGNTVEQMVQMFNESEKVILLVPPSGTRKNVTFWKTGFYWIALGANVPIVMAVIDYKQRKVFLELTLYPTGDIEADFEIIRKYYQERAGILPDFDRSKFLRDENGKIIAPGS
jgi:1-acyl-sn-glycerol-3-phosphate acyltransferase